MARRVNKTRSPRNSAPAAYLGESPAVVSCVNCDRFQAAREVTGTYKYGTDYCYAVQRPAVVPRQGVGMPVRVEHAWPFCRGKYYESSTRPVDPAIIAMWHEREERAAEKQRAAGVSWAVRLWRRLWEIS